MANKHQKLELTWIGKDEQPRLEPRILIEDAEKSYGLINRKISPNPSLSKRGTYVNPPLEKGGMGGFSDNMLIHGDNLLALKALEQDFAGQIKCACIDPPYNTGNAFEHYDDGLEHSIWLSLMKPRIEIIHKLLRNDGTLWIFIDDDESHYLKVLCDEVFGEENLLAQFVWRSRLGKGSTSDITARLHEYIVCYSKNIDKASLLPDIRIKTTTTKERLLQRLLQWGQGDKKEDRPTMYYAVYSDEFGEVYPNARGYYEG